MEDEEIDNVVQSTDFNMVIEILRDGLTEECVRGIVDSKGVATYSINSENYYGSIYLQNNKKGYETEQDEVIKTLETLVTTLHFHHLGGGDEIVKAISMLHSKDAKLKTLELKIEKLNSELESRS